MSSLLLDATSHQYSFPVFLKPRQITNNHLQTEDVIPSPTVQTGGMFLQLIQNLFHLERRGQSLNQYCRPNHTLLHPQVTCRKGEGIVPKTSFEMVFHLREVKIRPRTSGDEFAGVVEKVQTEVEEGAGHGSAVDNQTGFRKVPPSRSYFK